MRRWLTLAIGCFVFSTFAASWAFHVATYFGYGVGNESWLSAGGVWPLAVVVASGLACVVRFLDILRPDETLALRPVSGAMVVAGSLAVAVVLLYLLVTFAYWTKCVDGPLTDCTGGATVGVGRVGERLLSHEEAKWYRAHALRARSAMWITTAFIGLLMLRPRAMTQRSSAAAELAGSGAASPRTYLTVPV